MKKVLFLCVMFLVFSVAGRAHATLLLQDSVLGTNTVVFDDVTNRFWIYNVAMFEDLAYAQQVAMIEALPGDAALGIVGWQMATLGDMTTLQMGNTEHDIANAFSATYFRIEWWGYGPVTIHNVWGTIDHSDPALGDGHAIWGVGCTHGNNVAWNYDHTQPVGAYGEHHETVMTINPDDCPISWLGAWVVSSNAPVPEPATMLLLGSGLIGLAGFRRKKFKK